MEGTLRVIFYTHGGEQARKLRECHQHDHSLLSSAAESSSRSQVAFSRRAQAGKLMGVSSASSARTIACALPSGAFALFPAHATTGSLEASIERIESESFVETLPIPSTPVIGTTLAVDSTSGMSG